MGAVRVGYTSNEEVGRYIIYHKFATQYGWTPTEIDKLDWDIMDALEIIIDEEAKNG